MNINYLPPEVVTTIFSYLPQLDLLTTINTVSHYWNEVAFSRSLWKTIEIAYFTDDDKFDIYLQNIDHYREFVQKLSITRDHLIKLFGIRKDRNLSNLRTLEIMYHDPDIDVSFCKKIVDLYSGIVALRLNIGRSDDIFGCLSVLSNLQLRDFKIGALGDGNAMPLNKIICEFISKQCSFQSLKVYSRVTKSEAIIKWLRTRMDLIIRWLGNRMDLTCLDLSRCNGVSRWVLTALPELSKLTALDLSHTDVNDDDLKTIATKAIHLKKLTIMGCKSLSDIGIGYIADVCHCLEYLVIHNKEEITGVRLFTSTLESLGKGCQKLKHVDLQGLTGLDLDDSGVIALVQNCHDLEHVLLNTMNISSPSLHAISHSCNNLHYVSIHGYDFNAASVKSLLTEHIFIKVVFIGRCANINKIDLCKSTETNSGILETHSHARKLGIHGQTCIDYSAIEQIVTFCPDLRELSLPQIADAVHDNVIEIAFHKCRFLETLKINFRAFNRSDVKTNLNRDQ